MSDDGMEVFSQDTTFKSTIEYFNGDSLATDTWINKYALKDSYNNLYELNPNDTHDRIAKEIHRIEQKYSNPMSYDLIFSLLKNFKYIIPGGGSLTGIGNNLQVSSLSNCFVIGNSHDSYGGIMKTDEEQVQLMKRRGGVGHDLSHIRPKGSPVNNSALTSTGIVPFMERYSNSTREVAQEGRRGALMLSLSIKHPDSEHFIDAKMTQGKVTGANISLRISDDFMSAVMNDEPFTQQYPIDSNTPTITKDIDSKRLWNKIIHNVWESAEPGVLFWDNILKESPSDCYSEYGFRTSSTNPCFVGETIVAVADGRNGVTIKQLADEGVVFPVHSARRTKPPYDSRLKWDSDWEKEIKNATAFKTGYKKVIELILTDGTSFRCTEDHLLATKDGFYVEAKLSMGLYLVKFHEYSNNHSDVYVSQIIEKGFEDVYDLTVEDNHNFFILTSSDNENVLNNSGILVHNCGELPLCPDDSCRLLCLNLVSYVENPYTEHATFNSVLFKEHVIYAQRMMDDIIDLEIEKIDNILAKIKSDNQPDEIKQTEIDLWEKIKNKAEIGRRTGLGITSEGDMLAAMGYRYGSPEGIDFSVMVHKMLATQSYTSSIILAKERGCFSIWNPALEKSNPFIQRVLINNLDIDPEILAQYYLTGRRNISNLTIAPTGSVSIMTRTTSGIEPSFNIRYKRKRKVNPNDKNVNKNNVEYDNMGDAFEKYDVFHYGFQKWALINGYEIVNLSDEQFEEVYKKSPYYQSTSADINWVDKVRMQGLIQQWIDHSISVTTNLPNEATEEMVSDVYLTAWKSGCKGMTVYREGSRDGILISDKHQQKNDNIFKEIDVPKRPKILECDVIHFNNKGEKWVGVLGLVKDRPIEMFTGKWDNFMIPNVIDKGSVIKLKENGKTRYDFQYIDADGYKCTMEGLNRAFNREYHNYARLISGVLRQGMPLIYVYELVDGLKLQDGDSISDWKSGVKRLIKKHIKDGVKTKDICPECGANLIFSENCKKCSSCGYTLCG